MTKSYCAGLSNIITESRKLIEMGQATGIEKLITLMKVHESQQSAPIVASIAILIGNAIRIRQANISQTCDEALSNIIMWDVKVITVLSQLVTFVGFIL